MLKPDFIPILFVFIALFFIFDEKKAPVKYKGKNLLRQVSLRNKILIVICFNTNVLKILYMKTKNVLGLDIGTNSIGGALVKLPEDYSDYGKEGKIEWLGSRVLPDSDYKKAFEMGQTNSPSVNTPAATRRIKRGARRLKQRYKLRRTRLTKVFKALGWIDEEFPEDFKKAKRLNEDFKFSISDYLPFSDEAVMEFEKDFGIEGQKSVKNSKRNGGKSVLSEDWIVYYLRKKALKEKVEISELARIIYMLNQRRGFKSSRKDLKESNVLPFEEFTKRKNASGFGESGIETKFVCITKIEAIVAGEEKKNKKGESLTTYTIKATDSRMENWEEVRKNRPEWDLKGETFTFLVTQKVDKKGNFTQLKPQMPTDNDWALCTTALDEKIESEKYPGKYFYNEMLKAHKENKDYKIRQFPVYRWRYKEELEAIWNKQCELNTELNHINKDKATLQKLAELLYPTQAKNNLPKLKELLDKDLLHIISNDIIYYQRELKSQKNSISECRYEKRSGLEKTDDGKFIETGKYGLKCIPKSSPLFQEFRIWQDIHNIKILKLEEKIDGKTKLDVECTSKYITNDVKAALFNLFNKKASISETDILNLIKEYHPENDIVISKKKETTHSHRINLYANRESLKGNETKSRYRSIFNKLNYDGEQILNNAEQLQKLWHTDYSISSSDEKLSEKGIMSALGWKKENEQWKRIDKWGILKIPLVVALAIAKLPELKKEYGSYSAMAIKKLLPVMRAGNYWNKNNIGENIQKRIQKITDGEFDETINDETRIKIKRWEKENRPLNNLEDFYGLPTWFAGYVVYGIHSENEIKDCKNAEEFNNEVVLKLKNNSLRNPVVEQVVRETLLLVRDLWQQVESKNEKIDEIHIELGRDLKNNTDEKQNIAATQDKNFKEKQRIKGLLKELLNDGFRQYNKNEEIEQTNFEINPNPDSPIDIDKFRIWRNMSKHSELEWEKKVKDEKIPTEQEIKKYILWLSQDCRSPYTGKIIPLSKLFDETEYQKEHIIPRSKMKNDSMSNLVISEAAINPSPYKGSLLARNFISQFGGKEYEISGRKYSILSEEAYEQLVNDTFKFNKAKRRNLLATEVPEGFVERQLNDTRYITKKVAQLLKPVVGSDTKIIFTGGAITNDLKKNWGLTKEWKKLMLPRFKRLEAITGNSYIKQNEHDRNDIDINVPENEKLEIKRIDHRHHALDALIVAATTREHIRYLNTLSAADTDDEHKKIRMAITNPISQKVRDFKLPWETFTQNAIEKLEETIVSFKVNNRIITQPKNLFSTWIKNGDKLEKIKKEQKENPRWMAIRKSLFKEPLGVVYLKETKEVSVLDAFKTEIKRMLCDKDLEARKTASYIYDKQARHNIKQIIHQCNSSIDEKDSLIKEIELYLKKNKKEKGIYNLTGINYGKITIAEFVSKKTKRMALTKKDYVEKLTVEKMANDFPYFDTISKPQFEQFNADKQSLITKSGIKVSETKKMSAFNLLFLYHILEYNNNPKDAFGAEGLDLLNKKAKENACIGKEIKSVTRLDGEVDREDMFNGGFYETDKGAMAYFVMYENEISKERIGYTSIPTHKAVEKIIKRKPIAEYKEGYKKIILSPGDLVYIPTKEEQEKIISGVSSNEIIVVKGKKHLEKGTYRVAKFSKKQCYFIKANISTLVIPYSAEIKKGEFGSQNYQELNDEGIKLANVCIKLKVDRLGNIKFT